MKLNIHFYEAKLIYYLLENGLTDLFLISPASCLD